MTKKVQEEQVDLADGQVDCGDDTVSVDQDPMTAKDHHDEELVLDEGDEKSSAGDPAAGDPAAGDPAAGDPAAGGAAAGDPVESEEEEEEIAFEHEDDDPAADDEAEVIAFEPEDDGTDADGDSEDDSETEADRLRADLDAANQRVLRAVADFENYKRRSERERSESIKFANKQVFQQTLDVLDNFERALASAPDEKDNFVIGVRMIKKQLLDVLLQNGVEEVEAEGKPFDPYMHEAFAKEETDEYPDNSVIEVYQRGFKFHGTLLRPAKVKVAVAPEQSAAAAGEEASETND